MLSTAFILEIKQYFHVRVYTLYVTYAYPSRLPLLRCTVCDGIADDIYGAYVITNYTNYVNAAATGGVTVHVWIRLWYALQ